MGETEVDTLRRSYAALNDGDVDAALAALDDAAVWYESPELPGGDVFHGREAVRSFLSEFLADWRQFHQEVEDVVKAEDDRFAVLIHLTAVGRMSGIEADTRYAHVWTMRDGKGIKVEGYRDQDAARRSVSAP